MATHTIRYRDWRRRDEPRTIVWNDETGEVSGDHGDVPRLRRMMEKAVHDGYLSTEGSWVDVRDPRHDPADFLAVLRWAIGTRTFKRVVLPPALRGVEPTHGQAAPYREGVVY